MLGEKSVEKKVSKVEEGQLKRLVMVAARESLLVRAVSIFMVVRGLGCEWLEVDWGRELTVKFRLEGWVWVFWLRGVV